MRELKEELRLLHEPGSYVGEVVKLMSKKKILVKVQPEGKYVVDFDDKLIKLEDIKPNLRVALRNDTYALHKVRAGEPSTELHGTRVSECPRGRPLPHPASTGPHVRLSAPTRLAACARYDTIPLRVSGSKGRKWTKSNMNN